jgi:hypothetical protein
MKYGRREITYFGRHFAWLKYFIYRLVSVLAPNYKQHILSPAKVRKVQSTDTKSTVHRYELIPARNASLAAMQGSASGSNVRYYPA